MSPEEALKKIKSAGSCFVVFNSNTGEVISVSGLPVESTVDQKVEALDSMKTTVPTMGRFMEAQNVTRETLDQVRRDCAEMHRRVAIYHSWGALPSNELIRILTANVYPPEVDPMHGSEIIVELLFEQRETELSNPQLDDLRKLPVAPRSRFFATLLSGWLAVHDGNETAMIALCKGKSSDKDDIAIPYKLIELVGDLPARDPRLIKALIDLVERFNMFGPRFDAMIALGKTGSHSGPRAAQVIRESIHDSSEGVVQVREQVLKRIEMPAEQWIHCRECARGRVPNTSSPIPSTGTCPKCLGLGFVLRA